MSVTVKIGPILYQYTNDRGVTEVNGSTVAECLDELNKQFPGLEKGLFSGNSRLLHYIGIWINGEDAYPEELTKPVKDGDELYITYTTAVGGG